MIFCEVEDKTFIYKKKKEDIDVIFLVFESCLEL